MRPESTGTIELLALGDIALNDRYDRLLDSEGPDHPFALIQPLLNSADLVLGNLEGPLTKHDPVHPGKCSLRSKPEYAAGLGRAGITAVSLANNHILDSGQRGLEETRRHLKEAGIAYAGILEDAEVQRPALIRKNELVIGILAYCDVQIDSPFYFPEANPGIARFTRERSVADVRELSKETDCVIVSLHWGVEHFSYPSPRQRASARALIDAGASLVIGHHPHVVQGIEQYKNGYIAYSLGNFLFSQITWNCKTAQGKLYNAKVRLRRSNRRSVILRCRIDGKEINGVTGIPCRINPRLQAVEDHSVRGAMRLKNLAAQLAHEHYDGKWPARHARHKYCEVLREKMAWRRLMRIHRLRPWHLRDLYSSLSSVPKLNDSPEN